MSRAKELTDAHWNNYVGPLLTASGVEEKVIALCAFMYKSSGIHFYKHCQEDTAEAAREALANDAAHKAPSLCDDCRNVHECKLFDKGMRVTLCEEHRPSICDSEVEAPTPAACLTCAASHCHLRGRQFLHCVAYVPMEANCAP